MKLFWKQAPLLRIHITQSYTNFLIYTYAHSYTHKINIYRRELLQEQCTGYVPESASGKRFLCWDSWKSLWKSASSWNHLCRFILFHLYTEMIHRHCENFVCDLSCMRENPITVFSEHVPSMKKVVTTAWDWTEQNTSEGRLIFCL